LLNLYTRNDSLLSADKDVEREEMLEGKSDFEIDPKDIINIHPDAINIDMKPMEAEHY